MKPKSAVGDLWGGAAAMLVALPSSIAFGVTIYSTLDASQAAQGALAGILGATTLGLIAPAIGGTRRLISAPCAPAAAVLAAFAVEVMAGGAALATALLLLTVVGFLAGLIQVAMGAVRLGTLIKFVPYPVVSGYLSGVGLVIITSQTPTFLGVPRGVHFWDALAAPSSWRWQGMVVGAVTMAANSPLTQPASARSRIASTERPLAASSTPAWAGRASGRCKTSIAPGAGGTAPA